MAAAVKSVGGGAVWAAVARMIGDCDDEGVGVALIVYVVRHAVLSGWQLYAALPRRDALVGAVVSTGILRRGNPDSSTATDPAFG